MNDGPKIEGPATRTDIERSVPLTGSPAEPRDARDARGGAATDNPYVPPADRKAGDEAARTPPPKK